MRASVYYARQSDPADNPNFRRMWCEPERLLRQSKIIIGAPHKKPPPRPPDKERPAAAGTAHRPVQALFKTNASDYSRHHEDMEAARRARAHTEALFAQGGAS